MKLHKQQIEHILKSFQNLKNKNDLLILLNYAKQLLYGDKAFPFELRQLSYYSNPKVSQKRYEIFSVKKKSGGDRIIHSPVKGLKELQRSLNLILECVFVAHPSAMGFVKNKSILDNAKIHSGSYYVYNIDLKDFFFSIDQARVWKCLQNKPFDLGKKWDGVNQYEVVNIICALCCTEVELECRDSDNNSFWQSKNVVPQGAPTSPILTNIVCQRLDYILSGVAKRFGLKYTRYADDITFSSLHNVYNINGEFIREINRVVSDQGFNINLSKTRLQKQDVRQEVTGLVVNQFPNIQRRYIKRIRSWIYMWENYGYDKAYSNFLNDYIKDKGHIKSGVPNMLKILAGKLSFLKMIRGANDNLYFNLLNRFNFLLNIHYDFDGFIKTWETQGIYSTLSNNEKYRRFYKDIVRDMNNKITTDSQKNKIKSLLFRDFENSLLSGVLEIENILSNDDVLKRKKEHKINPRSVADFMNLFDDPNGLKYLTHDYDESDHVFDIDLFLQCSKEVFISKSKEHSIPRSLYAIINEFAFSQKPSWNKGCNDGWSVPTRIEWSKNEKKHLKRNASFSETIKSFRDLTRIEAPDLQHILDNILKEKLVANYSKFEINLENCQRADFYTNVNYFKEAIRLILDGCNKKIGISKKLSIKYSTRYEGDYRLRIITITHENSYPHKPLEDFLLEIHRKKGDLADVKEKLEGYCYWSIESIFDDKPIRVNLLRDYDTNEITNLEYNPIGFVHILTFYQK